MELNIPLETICRIILRAREYEAQIPANDPEDASNPSDDRVVDVLEDEHNISVEEELSTAIADLADDEQAELIALALVGRGSFDSSEWAEALEAASDETTYAVDFLMELPMLSAYLENGLAAFDLSCSAVGQLS